jgi:membrane protein YqaA with SNARE-associated domain
MRRIADWAQSLALALGAPGLFLVAILDSSVLTLPEINDILVVLMVTEHNARLPLYAGAATAGSIVGSLLLYSIGRKGGEAVIRRRFNSARSDRALRAIQRYGVMAVIIPSLLPPPMPFKMFVLLSGVTGMPFARFVSAVAIGRGTRYFGEGLLALRYGDQTLAFLHEHSGTVAVVLGILLAVGLAAYVVWNARQTAAAGRDPTE